MTKRDLEALLAAASPGPWFLDGFDLHDAGTWMIAVMAREGNPSYGSDPEATKKLAALAPALAREVLGRREVGEEMAGAVREAWHNPKQGFLQPCACVICQALARWAKLHKAEERDG